MNSNGVVVWPVVNDTLRIISLQWVGELAASAASAVSLATQEPQTLCFKVRLLCKRTDTLGKHGYYLSLQVWPYHCVPFARATRAGLETVLSSRLARRH